MFLTISYYNYNYFSVDLAHREVIVLKLVRVV